MKRNQYVNLRSEHLREIILKTAGECVEQFGLRATTVLKVAEMAGVSRQTVHSYFPTKDHLIGEVILKYMLDGIKKTLDKVDLSKPPQTVVAVALRGMWNHMQQPTGCMLMAYDDRDIAIKAAHTTKDLHSVYVTELWIPILTHLKSNGHLRADIDLVDTGKWLYLIGNTLLQEEWIKLRDLNRIIETFVAPSILRSI